MNRNDIVVMFYTILLMLFFASYIVRGFQLSILEPITLETFVNFFSSAYYIIILLGFSAILPEGQIIKKGLYWFLRFIAPAVTLVLSVVAFFTEDILT